MASTPVRAVAAAPSGWNVVDQPVAARTHVLTVALVAPQGTEPSFTVADARKSVADVIEFFRKETDGKLMLQLAAVEDWRRMTDSTPCSWSSALQDWVAGQNGWQRSALNHLVVMVPTGDPCPGWANGEQGQTPTGGGRTYQPGTDPTFLSHELGHNMSSAHAFSIQCAGAWDFSTLGSGVPDGCTRQEYGNRLDDMGGAWTFSPYSSPTLNRFGMLPRRFEPACGAIRTLSMSSVGNGAAGRTSVSWVDPTDNNARYWVDFRAVSDGQKYRSLHDSQWAFRPDRAGLQIIRTDPQVPFGTAVLERPGDSSDYRQLTALAEKVPLAGGSWVSLQSVDAAGESGEIAVYVPCSGSQVQAASSITSLTASRVAHGGMTTVTATVRSTDGNPPTGTVSIASGTTEIGRGTLTAQGKASIQINSSNQPVGLRTLDARYSGDATHLPSTHSLTWQIDRAKTTTSVSVIAPDTKGRNAVATITAARSPQNPAVPREVEVALWRGSSVVSRQRVELTDGIARWNLPTLKSGSYRVAAKTRATDTTYSSAGQAVFTTTVS